MRSVRPKLGNNVLNEVTYWGKCGVNGGAAPAAWLAGGKGLGVPVRTGAGVWTITMQDPPIGVFLGCSLDMETDALANAMNVDYTWSEDAAVPPKTYVLTLRFATRGTPGSAADPPAAADGRRVFVALHFCDPTNV